jgi:hypothetical protein
VSTGPISRTACARNDAASKKEIDIRLRYSTIVDEELGRAPDQDYIREEAAVRLAAAFLP